MSERERERVCVCVCGWVCERERALDYDIHSVCDGIIWQIVFYQEKLFCKVKIVAFGMKQKLRKPYENKCWRHLYCNDKVCVFAYVCVCVCVRERERERERKRERITAFFFFAWYWVNIETNLLHSNIVVSKYKLQSRYYNSRSSLLRCGSRPNEWGTQWDSNSLLQVC